jgi:hypothetical protein
MGLQGDKRHRGGQPKILKFLLADKEPLGGNPFCCTPLLPLSRGTLGERRPNDDDMRRRAVPQ